MAFASSVRAPEVSQIGAPCPDHLINTKHKPLVVEFDPEHDGAAELGDAFRRGVEEYAGWYRDYYERNLDDETRQFPIDPAGPRVVARAGRRRSSRAGTMPRELGSPATSTTARSPSRTRQTRSAASDR